MPIYDVNKIEDIYNDFVKCKEQFKNKEYDDFNSSYFCNCRESIIVRLRNKIKNIYSNINTGYSNIDKFWNEYIDDIKTTENSIKNGTNTSKGSNVSSVLSKLNGLELAYDGFNLGNAVKAFSAKNSIISKSETFFDDPVAAVDNFILRTSATVANATYALSFSVCKFGEKLFDGVTIIGAAATSLGFVGTDIINGIKTGNWKFNSTAKYFNKVLQFTSKNVVEGWQDEFYKSESGKSLDDLAFKPFKRGEIGYSITEGVGELAGLIAINAIPGVGQAAVGVTYGVSAFGETTTKLYNQKAVITDEDGLIVGYNDLDIGTITKIGATGAAHGVIEGGMAYLTYGDGIKVLSKSKNSILRNIGLAARNTKYGAESVAHAVNGELIKRGFGIVGKEFLKNNLITIGTKASLQAGKVILKSAATEASDLVEVDWDKTKKDASIAAITSVIYDASKVGMQYAGVKLDLKSGKSVIKEPKIGKDGIVVDRKKYAEELKEVAEQQKAIDLISNSSIDDLELSGSSANEISNVVANENNRLINLASNVKETYGKVRSSTKIFTGGSGDTNMNYSQSKLEGKIIKSQMKEVIKNIDEANKAA